MKSIKPDSTHRYVTERGGILIDSFTTPHAVNGMGLNRSVHLLLDGTVLVDEQPFTGPRSTRVGTKEEFLEAYPELRAALEKALQ